MTANTATPAPTAPAGQVHTPTRQPWTLPLNDVEDFEIKVVAGCPCCEFDEAEGGLFNHCKDCQQEITTAAYELFVRRDHSMQPRTTHSQLLAQNASLREALKDLSRAYVSLLEEGHRRIIDSGGQCDSVEVMERGDPYLAKARAALKLVTP